LAGKFRESAGKGKEKSKGVNEGVSEGVKSRRNASRIEK